MKNIILIIFLLLSISSFAQSQNSLILEKNLEMKIISRGDNVPDFNRRKDSANFLLVYLHENLSVKKFKKDTKLSDRTVNRTVAMLKSKNWLTEKKEKLKPSVFIATAKDGKKLYRYAKPVSTKIADEIEKDIPNIKAKFYKTKMSENKDFEHWSFFILSNVLLDNWQIFEVEKAFLKTKDRPFRHGKHYYASIQENTEKNKESFGIYGNQGLKFTDSTQLWVYGNNRLDNKYLETLESSENKINNADNQILYNMAQNFLPKLLTILESNCKYAEKIYEKTGYSQEITFEEFFIWWYHFIYSQTTDQLRDRKLLIIPSSGNFDYEL